MCDYTVMVGNPADAPLLVPAVKRVIARAGAPPGAVTADRGYGEAAVERELAVLSVARIAIPRRGRAGLARHAVERARPFRRLVRWRTGCEGRISQLKHHFGWAPHPAERPPGCPAVVHVPFGKVERAVAGLKA